MLGRCFRLLCLMDAENWGERARAQAEGEPVEMCGFGHRELKFEGGMTIQRRNLQWELQGGQDWR